MGWVAGMALLVAAVAPQVALAGNGDSDAAKACQKGGWEQLVRGEDGTGFRNVGDCVSHAATSGQVVPRRTFTVSFSPSDLGPIYCTTTISVSGYPASQAIPLTFDIPNFLQGTFSWLVTDATGTGNYELPVTVGTIFSVSDGTISVAPVVTC